jgi:hypothetical protein
MELLFIYLLRFFQLSTLLERFLFLLDLQDDDKKERSNFAVDCVFCNNDYLLLNTFVLFFRD